jgi:SAM-dependent methyltransferase
MFYRGFRIARCSNCDFIFVNPRPPEKSLLELYSNGEQNPFFAADYEPVEYEQPVLSKIIGKIQNYVRKGGLLEIGCGRGDFLRIAQMHGFSVTGCDIFGGRKPAPEGIAFYDGTLKEAKFPNDFFDVVVIRNLFEHLFDPNIELKEISRTLKPGGYLYLKVPNVAFEHGLLCQLVFGKTHVFDPPYHLNYFCPSSLQRFLKNGHFKFLSWYIEQPTLRSRWTANLFRQTSYRLIQAISFLSGGRAFPKVLLSCVAQKTIG